MITIDLSLSSTFVDSNVFLSESLQILAWNMMLVMITDVILRQFEFLQMSALTIWRRWLKLSRLR